jgi:hypothetical protein
MARKQASKDILDPKKIVALEKQRELGRLTQKKQRLARQQRFIELYKESRGNVSNTCLMIKIHRNTYYKWLKNQPAFRIAIKHADADLDDTVEQVLIDKAKHGSSSELLFYLKKRHEKYKDTPTAIGVKGENIEVVIIDYKSREE